jgi:hypothetical protein
MRQYSMYPHLLKVVGNEKISGIVGIVAIGMNWS